jgi:heavy metal translocating P-type ATPase
MVAPVRCDLCGLEANPPVIRSFDGEEKYFCCEGCARVYTAARENGMLEEVLGLTSGPAKARETPRPKGDNAYFSIGGMFCAGCAVAAQNVLRRVPGVQSAEVSFAAERGRIDYDPLVASPEEVLRTLDSLGYRARLSGDQEDREATRRQQRTLLQLITAAGFGMQVMLLYLVQLYHLYSHEQFNTPMVRHLQYLCWLMATPVLFYGGSSFLRGAWRALRSLTATMDTLVALGTLSAYGYSVYVTVVGGAEAYFDAVTMITTFVMLGRWLETIGGTHARGGVRKLLALHPELAWIKSGEEWVQVRSNLLGIGDTILVKQGERVPADATIVEGHAAVDESLLTGESTPVEKGLYEPIYAGSVVTDAAVVATVKRTAGTTRLSRIAQLVEKTLAAKPPVQRMADKASVWFATEILFTALVTGVVWWLVDGSVPHALINAVAVLVVACPCALGLATPLAVTVSIGRAAEKGVLIRNPAALEQASRVTRVVFDKTGTLTEGHPGVIETIVLGAEGRTSDDVLQMAARLEQYSSHPLAEAIVAAGSKRKVNASGRSAPIKDQRILPGMGISGRIGMKKVYVGSSQYFSDSKLVPYRELARAHNERGETTVWIGEDDHPVGLVVLRDNPNPLAAGAVAKLRADGLQVALLSGDSVETTRAIASELGVEDLEGRCLPPEKAARVKAWQKEGQRVLMVGDGVNDAPALAQADVGVTAAGGTDIAGETSDLVLMRSDLMLVPWFIEYARRTRHIILENLWWAFGYNLLVVPLAAFGLISPVIAAAAMATSSLMVVGNSLRLKR